MRAWVLALAMSLVMSASAAAVTIYDNGGSPAGGTFSGIASDSAVPQFVADDFVLQPGLNTITDIHWSGGYAPTSTPDSPDAFTVEFYADVSGVPAFVPFDTFTPGSAVNRTTTGIVLDGVELFSYSIDIAPLTLSPAVKFWLSIVNNTTPDTDDSWFWSSPPNLGGLISFRTSAGAADEWSQFTGGSESDFRLTGPDAVPAPPTILLLALGVITGIVVARHRIP